MTTPTQPHGHPHINIGLQDNALPLSKCDPLPITLPCLITVLPPEFVIFTPTHTLHSSLEQVSHSTHPDFIVQTIGVFANQAICTTNPHGSSHRHRCRTRRRHMSLRVEEVVSGVRRPLGLAVIQHSIAHHSTV